MWPLRKPDPDDESVETACSLESRFPLVPAGEAMKVKAPFRIEHRWEKRKYPWCIVTQHFFYLLELRGRLYVCRARMGSITSARAIV